MATIGDVEVEEIGVDLGPRDMRVIEFYMMDKWKYYPLTLTSSFSIRTLLYPFGLIKTRLQIQAGKAVYNGTWDAVVKISRTEGIGGLYKGFLFSCLQVFPSICYITTYESIRNHLLQENKIAQSTYRAFIAGGCASIVGQTLTVPIDIVTQHLMLLGHTTRKKQADKKIEALQRITIPDTEKGKKFHAAVSVIKQVYRRDGVRGFYKGYGVSICVFAPNSALWWFFYDAYADFFMSHAPYWAPRLALQVVAAPLAGVTAAGITNFLDVIRARIQVEGTKLGPTCRKLWNEEGVRFVVKGLSARLVQSVAFSFFIMLGYESIKRLSLKEEYKQSFRW